MGKVGGSSPPGSTWLMLMKMKVTLDDEMFMRKCIELADEAGSKGDLPFGAIVVSGDGKVIGEGSNILQQKKEVDGHAERIALSQAQSKMKTRILPDCTVYTTVEPCPMCSFPIRELHIARVVFGLRSPVMGGFTKFKVLQDSGLSDKVLNYFGPPPVVVGGVLKEECVKSWKRWVPKIWDEFSKNGVLD